MHARPVHRGSVEVLRLEVISPIQNFGSVKMYQSGSGMEYNKHGGSEVVPRAGRG